MNINDRVLQAVFRAVDVLNQQLMQNEQLEKSRDTRLFGPSGKIDSLGLVNLIVATEQEIEKEFQTSINLAADLDLTEQQNAFETIENLASYITSLVGATCE